MMNSRCLTAVLLVLGALGAGPAASQALYWTDTNFPAPEEGKATVTGVVDLTVPLAAETLPEGIAFDALGGMVYWVEGAFSDARVLRADMNLGAPATLVSGGSALRGIAVDGASNRIYWTSSNLITGSAIHRAGLNGSSPEILIALGSSSNPRDLDLDPIGGRLYWADFDQSEIRRAGVDGTAGAALATLSPGVGPWGVAYDPSADRIYWTEYNSGAIRGVDASGANLNTVLSGRTNPTYLSIDPAAGKLYWTEAGGVGPRVHRANLDGSGLEDLPIPMATFGGIVFTQLGTTSAQLLWFEAGAVEEGIELRWSFREADAFNDVWIERSEAVPGIWQRIAFEVTESTDGWTAIDREVVVGTTYHYRLVASTGPGETEVFGEIEALAGGGVTEFSLAPLAPNPATGPARIGFALPRESSVRVSVIDARGRLVAKLLDGVQSAGRHEISWNGQAAGGRAAAGAYYIRLEAPGFQQTRGLILTR